MLNRHTIDSAVMVELCYLLSYKSGKHITYRITSISFSNGIGYRGNILIDGILSKFFWSIDVNSYGDNIMIVNSDEFNNLVNYVSKKL